MHPRQNLAFLFFSSNFVFSFLLRRDESGEVQEPPPRSSSTSSLLRRRRRARNQIFMRNFTNRLSLVE